MKILLEFISIVPAILLSETGKNDQHDLNEICIFRVRTHIDDHKLLFLLLGDGNSSLAESITELPEIMIFFYLSTIHLTEKL